MHVLNKLMTEHSRNTICNNYTLSLNIHSSHIQVPSTTLLVEVGKTGLHFSLPIHISYFVTLTAHLSTVYNTAKHILYNKITQYVTKHGATLTAHANNLEEISITVHIDGDSVMVSLSESRPLVGESVFTQVQPSWQISTLRGVNTCPGAGMEKDWEVVWLPDQILADKNS